MFKTVDEKFIAKCTKDGSFLKKKRSIGGIGAGLSALGIMFIAVTIMFLALYIGLGGYDSQSSGAFIGFGGAILVSIVLIIIGRSMSKKKTDNYMSYYLKKSSCTEQQLQEFDKEVVESTSEYYITNGGKLQNNSAIFCTIMTRNWLFVCANQPIRLADIAAVFFEKEAYYKNRQWGHNMFIVLSTGEIKRIGMEEADARDIMERILLRNPLTIGIRRISVQSQSVDCLNQPEEAARLYRSIVSAKHEEAGQ